MIFDIEEEMKNRMEIFNKIGEKSQARQRDNVTKS